MGDQNPSPGISGIAWGRVTVKGNGAFKDVKLYPGGAREWDWNETGTRHDPGIQPEDVEELLEHHAEVVILSRGFHERLKVCEDTVEYLDRKNVPCHILQTEEAVARYNELTRSHRVGALIHSTC